MGVDQILSWCKGTWPHRSPHFVICTDVPVAHMSPSCDLHGYPHILTCIGVPISWSDCSSVLQQQRVSEPCTSGWFGTEVSCWWEIQTPSSKQLTFACGWKRDKWISREQYSLTLTSFSELSFPDIIAVTRKGKISFSWVRVRGPYQGKCCHKGSIIQSISQLRQNGNRNV